MVGGFLGAGKTTALLRAAERLTARGLRVGLITNDQSGGLVDTAIARADRVLGRAGRHFESSFGRGSRHDRKSLPER